MQTLIPLLLIVLAMLMFARLPDRMQTGSCPACGSKRPDGHDDECPWK